MKSFYIKERHNPQIGIYHIALGQLTKKEAKAKEQSLYGGNIILEYKSEDDYNAALNKFGIADGR